MGFMCKCCLATPRLAGCDPEGGQGQAGMPTRSILVRSELLASCCTESMPSFSSFRMGKTSR